MMINFEVKPNPNRILVTTVLHQTEFVTLLHDPKYKLSNTIMPPDLNEHVENVLKTEIDIHCF